MVRSLAATKLLLFINRMSTEIDILWIRSIYWWIDGTGYMVWKVSTTGFNLSKKIALFGI